MLVLALKRPSILILLAFINKNNYHYTNYKQLDTVPERYEAASNSRTIADRTGFRLEEVGMLNILSRRVVLFTAALCIAAATPAIAGDGKVESPAGDQAAKMTAPELGQQMLELQIRHNRLWWAGEAGNWNLAYYMVSELGEALRGIEATNGDAPELQPQKLSEVMPRIMNPAIQTVQQALAQRKKVAFRQAYDKLSAACTACHKEAGVDFLQIQRPKTPLLDNLRYAPTKGN